MRRIRRILEATDAESKRCSDLLACILANYKAVFSAGASPRTDVGLPWLKNDRRFLRDGSMLPAYSAAARKNILIHWLCSTWCNYRCPYCFEHDHRRHKGSHCFDIYSVSTWITAFDKHFHGAGLNVLLSISGGELTMDAANMCNLLNALCQASYILSIRLDTNASWNPQVLESVADKSKIWLNCSFHPSHARLDSFLQRIDQYLRCGYNVAMVTLVPNNTSLHHIDQLRHALPKQIPLNLNPDVNRSPEEYDPELAHLFRCSLPPIDYEYKFMHKNPSGQRCLHPAVAYQMVPNGGISVSCCDWLPIRNFVSEETLSNLCSTYTFCPKTHCDCSDMYSFLEHCDRNLDLNPLYSYRNDLSGVTHSSACSFAATQVGRNKAPELQGDLRCQTTLNKPPTGCGLGVPE